MPTFYPHPCTKPAAGQVITGTFGWTIETIWGYERWAIYRHKLEDELSTVPFQVHVKAKCGWVPQLSRYIIDIDDDLNNRTSVHRYVGTIYEPYTVLPHGSIDIRTSAAGHAQDLPQNGLFYIPLPPLGRGSRWSSVRNIRPSITLRGQVRPLPQAHYNGRVELTTRQLPNTAFVFPYYTTIMIRIDDLDTGQGTTPMYHLEQFHRTADGLPALVMCGRIKSGSTHHRHSVVLGEHTTAAVLHVYYKGSVYHIDLRESQAHSWTFPRPIE